MKKVLVTGANGHLGNVLCRTLKQYGFHVIGTIRDMSQAKHLIDQGIEIVPLRLDSQTDWDNLPTDIEGIFHTAAPNQVWTKSPEHDLINVPLAGIKHLFNFSKTCHLKKIIFTSSASTFGIQASLDKPITEESPRPNLFSPLLRGKLLSEELFLDLAQSQKLNVATIHPTGIVGPQFYRLNSNIKFYERLICGKMLPLPKLGINLVDVRDVARAHVEVYNSENAKGAFLVGGEFFETNEFYQLLSNLKLRNGHRLKVPKFTVPSFLLKLAERADFLGYQFFNKERELTKELLADLILLNQRIDCKKITSVFHFKPMRIQDSIQQMIYWLEDLKGRYAI